MTDDFKGIFPLSNEMVPEREEPVADMLRDIGDRERSERNDHSRLGK